MTTRTLMVLAAACIVGSAGLVLVLWITGHEPDITHEEAMAAWPELVANNFQGNRRQIRKTYVRCFRVGDPISKYAELLSTAKTRADVPLTYEWFWDLGHGGEGDAVFVLQVEGNPPTITQAYIAEICH